MPDEETFFDKFWQASSLDKFNVQQFAAQLSNYDSDNKELLLEYPTSPAILPKTNSRLNKIAAQRKSDRSFSGEQFSKKELGLLLSSFYGWNGLEHRGFPSAGATYATEIYGVAFRVKEYNGKIFYYDPEKHGITVTGDAPTWEEASTSLNMSITGTPSLLLVFVIFPERALAKYGERGGRFALLEAGAAMQQLSLQVAESSNMKGVVVGGMLDEVWKSFLNIGGTEAKIALGYLLGK